MGCGWPGPPQSRYVSPQDEHTAFLDMSVVKDRIKKMTEEEEKQVDRNELQKRIRDLEATLEHKDKKSDVEPEGFSLPLDDDDKLRLENLVLRERLAERDKADARNSFYIYLSKKYNINPDERNISVDAITMKMTLTAK